MNKVSHFHIPVNDLDRARKFYSNIFGWQIATNRDEKNSKNKHDYILAITTPIDKTGRSKDPGGINGALFIRENPEDTISIVIRVKSIDDYLEKIEKAGCKIITKKTPARNIGFHAKFYDTENNIIGLWEEKDRMV